MPTERNFEDLEDDLTSNFKIDDYLEMRRRFPGEDSGLWMVLAHGETIVPRGIEYAISLEPEFKKFDLNLMHLLGVLDGDTMDIDQLCLECLKAISEREKLEATEAHAVANGTVIGDALIDFLIGAILESISFYELEVPHSFQVLTKYRLGLFNNRIKEGWSQQNRKNGIARVIAQNPKMSMRKVAEAVNVNVGTISRWMKEPDFQKTIEIFRETFPD